MDPTDRDQIVQALFEAIIRRYRRLCQHNGIYYKSMKITRMSGTDRVELEIYLDTAADGISMIIDEKHSKDGYGRHGFFAQSQLAVINLMEPDSTDTIFKIIDDWFER